MMDTPAPKSRRFAGWKGRVVAVLVPVLALVLLELLLRMVGGLPKGQFAAWFPGSRGLYPENATIEMTWGAIPYTVHVNSLGLRGPEPEINPDTVLIAAIGDSYTDGFFVDDTDTYPVRLRQLLREQHGLDAEVINVARAGGSIDRQLAILREIVLPLKPGVVVLQFCTNDIEELKGRTREELLAYELRPGASMKREFGRWLLTRTALGEFAYDAWLRATRPQYRQARALIRSGGERYHIAGGTNFLANSQLFRERFAKTDGLVLAQPFSPETEALVGSYLYALEHFAGACEAGGASLVFVYEPAYPQVYEPDTSLEIRDRLRTKCDALGAVFVDLTPAFQSEGADQPVHLAPVDFHLNPRGNQLTASCIATALVQRVLLDHPRSSAR